MSRFSKNIRNELAKSIKFIRIARIRPKIIIMSVVSSLIATAGEAAFIGALIPFVRGVINGDFLFVQGLPFFRRIILLFPATSAPNRQMFIILLAVIIVAVISKNLFQYTSLILLSYQFRETANTIRKLVFGRYLIFGKLFFDRHNIGRLQSILLDYTTLIARQLRSASECFSNFFMLLMYIVIMFRISWELTILIVFSFPLLSYLLTWLIKKIERTSFFYAESYGKLGKKISNILSCILLVKLYRNEESENRHFKQISDQLKALEFSIDKKTNVNNPIQEIAFLLIIMLLVTVMSFMLIKHKRGDVASFMIYFYLLRKSQYNFGVLNNIRSSLAAVRGQISQILMIFDDRDKFVITDGREEFKGLDKKIEFKNLEFSYSAKCPVLRGISFIVEKNKTTAIVGPTGSGKTTLISLLLRLYDCAEGQIIIDGKDIRGFSLTSLMNHFAYVSQDTMLFNDTLRNNMAYGREGEIPERKLIEVSKQARLFDYIVSLPEKFDTYIGDRGVILSGGEKQRVAIARALLKEAEILIMDEATSSLDSKTERLIQGAINEAIKGKTAIVITHRLSTIKHADKIIVIEDGRLVEEGGLNNLLEKKKKFYEYWQEQKFY